MSPICTFSDIVVSFDLKFSFTTGMNDLMLLNSFSENLLLDVELEIMF